MVTYQWKSAGRHIELVSEKARNVLGQWFTGFYFTEAFCIQGQAFAFFDIGNFS